MNKPNNDGMDLVEFLVLLLSQDDVTGFTFIMPGQNPIINFKKEGESESDG